VKEDRLKILLINFRDITNPKAGGAEVHLHEIFKRVAGMGHRVDLLCAGFRGSKKTDEVDGIRIIRVGGESYFNFAAQVQLLRIKGGSYDLIIEDVNKIPVYSKLFTKTPVMLIIPHLFGTTVFEEASVPIALYVYLWEFFMPVVYRGLIVEVISESTREDLLRRGFEAENLYVVYCGIDTDVYSPGTADSNAHPYPYIVCMGRLKKYKRVDLVLRAFSELSPEHKNLHLLIIGDGDHAPQLKKLACRLGIREKVMFTGFMDEQEKVRHLRGARMAVNTSPKEGWGLTNIEAQACGIPVIASDSPGLRESVKDGETGLLVPHGDIGSLTESMRTLLTDDDLHRKLSRGALSWAGSLSWDRSAGETLEIIFRYLRGIHTGA